MLLLLPVTANNQHIKTLRTQHVPLEGSLRFGEEGPLLAATRYGVKMPGIAVLDGRVSGSSSGLDVCRQSSYTSSSSGCDDDCPKASMAICLVPSGIMARTTFSISSQTVGFSRRYCSAFSLP